MAQRENTGYHDTGIACVTLHAGMLLTTSSGITNNEMSNLVTKPVTHLYGKQPWHHNASCTVLGLYMCCLVWACAWRDGSLRDTERSQQAVAWCDEEDSTIPLCVSHVCVCVCVCPQVLPVSTHTSRPLTHTYIRNRH